MTIELNTEEIERIRKYMITELIRRNEWKYIIRFKEGAIPSLYNEFEKVVVKANESTTKDYEYVLGIDYQEEKGQSLYM